MLFFTHNAVLGPYPCCLCKSMSNLALMYCFGTNFSKITKNLCFYHWIEAKEVWEKKFLKVFLNYLVFAIFIHNLCILNFWIALRNILEGREKIFNVIFLWFKTTSNHSNCTVLDLIMMLLKAKLCCFAQML